MASSVHVVISSRFVCSRVRESYLYAKYWDIIFIRAAMLKQANMETRPLGQKCNKPGRRNRGAQWHVYLHTKCGGGLTIRSYVRDMIFLEK